MKNIGKLLIIGAIMMIAFYFIYNIFSDKKVEGNINSYIEETSIVENETVDNEVEESNEEKKENKKQREINYTAILEIPSIELNRGVVDSTKNFHSINYSISVDKHSNYPNEKGNFILYAHSGNSGIAYFKNLNKVNNNDKVYVYFNGIKYEYIIVDKYNEEKDGKVKVLDTNIKNYITLITCDQADKNKQIILIGELINKKNY